MFEEEELFEKVQQEEPKVEGEEDENKSDSESEVPNNAEHKNNVLINSEFEDFQREIKKIMKKQDYKYAFGLLEAFNDRKQSKLSISDKIRMNRWMLYCLQKLIKNNLLEKTTEEPKFIFHYINFAVKFIFEQFRFLNIFITKI